MNDQDHRVNWYSVPEPPNLHDSLQTLAKKGEIHYNQSYPLIAGLYDHVSRLKSRYRIMFDSFVVGVSKTHNKWKPKRRNKIRQLKFSDGSASEIIIEPRESELQIEAIVSPEHPLRSRFSCNILKARNAPSIKISFKLITQADVDLAVILISRAPSLRLGAPPAAATAPTANEEELRKRVKECLCFIDLAKPAGNPTPIRQSGSTESRFERIPAVAAWVLKHAKGVCDLCKMPAPFLDKDGDPYLEVHHVQSLSENGGDIPENCAALCPNCHRKCHFGLDAMRLRGELQCIAYSRG